jgi:hypothetical protein
MEDAAMWRRVKFFASLACIIPMGIVLTSVAIWMVRRMWLGEWDDGPEEPEGPEEPDGYVTAVAQDEEMVRPEIMINGQIKRYRHEVPLGVFLRFCKAAKNGESLGVNAWTGELEYFERTDNEFDRQNPRGYEPFRQFFLDYDLLVRQSESKRSRIYAPPKGKAYFAEMVRKYG